MPTAADHGRVVLGAVLFGSGSMTALQYARQRLGDVHFEDPGQRDMFTLLCRYADQAGGILPRKALEDVLRNRDPGAALVFLERYDALAGRCPAAHEFRHSVDQLRELAAARGTGDALAQAMQILRHGVTGEHGELRGHADARRHALGALAAVERDAGLTSTPEGDVTAEGDDVLAEYARTKELRRQGRSPGVEFGLAPLDEAMEGGLLRGEFALVLSATSGGKSSLCVQTAWHGAVVQGLNVVVFTNEALRDQVRRKIVTRHSRLPRFGLERGINEADIRAGRLTEEGERALAAVTADLKTGQYGRLNVVQLPDDCTVSMLAARYTGITRQYGIDLAILDYAQLLTPERNGRDAREHENLGGIVKALARFAVSADGGRGVPLISPWQVKREGQERLKSAGGYQLEDAAGTAEAERAAHVVLSLAAREEDTTGGRAAPVEGTILKNRSGPRGYRLRLTADFATSCFTSREAVDEAVLNELEA
jgi:replicative DNA helicase